MATTKQKKAFVKFIENHGNIYQAMIEAGYDHNTAINPSLNLTNSKGWEELKKEFLPDETLLKVHLEGLVATKIHTSHTEPDKIVEDHATRAKYLDMAYKVKGNYAAEKPTQTINIEELKITIQQNLATFRANARGTAVLPGPIETI